jgi:hypothetical protein
MERSPVIVSVHLADVGKATALRLLARKRSPAAAPEPRYAELTTAAPLSSHLLPRPTLGRVGLIAAWDSDEALDGFLAGHPLAAELAHGWHVRLAPTRIVGAWSKLDGIPRDEAPMSAREPAAVLTLGRLRLSQTLRFLKASAAAEGLARRDPALLASTGLARPPALVATFSLWQNTTAMRAYASGDAGEGHVAATRAHAMRPFHHESAFVRFRPYGSAGSWDGKDPLAGGAAAA